MILNPPRRSAHRLRQAVTIQFWLFLTTKKTFQPYATSFATEHMEPHNIDHLGGLAKGYNNNQPKWSRRASPGASERCTAATRLFVLARAPDPIYVMILVARHESNQTWLVFSPGLRLAYYATFPFYEPINCNILCTKRPPSLRMSCDLLSSVRPARSYCKLRWTSNPCDSLSALINPFYATRCTLSERVIPTFPTSSNPWPGSS